MTVRDPQLSFDFGDPGQETGSDKEDIDIHAKRLAGYLTVRLPEPVDVVFTNNRSTMVSFKRGGGRLSVRLHRLFRLADENILDALALYIGRKDRNSSRTLDEFIMKHRAEIEPKTARRRSKLKTKGTHYDLAAVLDKLNLTYFDGGVDVAIGWGRAPRRNKRGKARRVSRALATYSFDDRSIRVSPVLDSGDIPDFIVDWVVYHEMLHHVLPIEERGGKKRYHTERFKNLEKAFEKYEEAKRWEKANIDKLLF